eukprot:CAMPEP_0203754246 /NCGR_PEP_ID=MMETSP0098-20131031/7870_1 /ASSEMBLY_ACC=CAM_ASM_000208 /TAXON_ID=96639 /ORGANISM=" , Strain NY0313808BC1" /LENGTH=427 /DNA_ID=CAMNT_0050645163 /DNA_START=73 /DNA_END=1353 /DNA_ORIENTATION=-
MSSSSTGDQPEEVVDMKQISEEYKVWKKNTPFLYDLVITHALEWPSLTVQWLQKKKSFDNDCTEQELLLGTHTAASEQNHLMIAQVKLPKEDAEIDARKYDDERGELGGYGGKGSKISIKMTMNHDGEVNRARYMPQDDYIIATKTVQGDVDVFYVREHESSPSKDGKAEPNIRCKGHEKEGYGLDWSPLERGHLLSGSDDAYICRWDINAKTKSDRTLQPVDKFRGHAGVIGEVQYHKHHKDLCGSVGDDYMFNLWDFRDLKTPKESIKAHEKEIQGLSFSPFNEFLVLTGGSDNLVKLWDLRKLENPLHVFQGHEDEIFKVEWSPFNEAIMGSCGADRRVMVWDLSRIGQEQDAQDAEDGPPELLFIHGGHTSKVSDFSWNPNDPWVIASVSEDNIVQVWQMAENIYAEDNEEEGNPAEDGETKI